MKQPRWRARRHPRDRGRLRRVPPFAGIPLTELDVEAGYTSGHHATTGPTRPSKVKSQSCTRCSPTCQWTALDAACGTGRHAAKLTQAGHRVIGVDRTEAMLGIAARQGARGRLQARSPGGPPTRRRASIWSPARWRSLTCPISSPCCVSSAGSSGRRECRALRHPSAQHHPRRRTRGLS